jgi:hypothetical protein
MREKRLSERRTKIIRKEEEEEARKKERIRKRG